MTDHIKIRNIIPRIQYIADGNNTVYEFPFSIFEAKNIVVYIDETILNKGYQIDIKTENDGGEVTFSTAPAIGQVITFMRDLEIERLTDFQEGGALRAKSLNDELDFQIACVQQIAENLNRTLVLPPYATSNNLNLTLPTPKAGKAIIWSEDANGLENSDIEINALIHSMESKLNEAKEHSNITSQKADETLQNSEKTAEQASIANTLVTQISEEIDDMRTSVRNALENNGSNVKLPVFLQNIGFVGKTTVLSGYYTLPDGLMIQWGTVWASSGWTNFNYPIAFPSKVLMVMGACSSDDGFSGSSALGTTSVKANSLSNFIARYGAGNQNGPINYIAIGY